MSENEDNLYHFSRLKLIEWKQIYHDFRDDNPNTDEDDILRDLVKNEIDLTVAEIRQNDPIEDNDAIKIESPGREAIKLRSVYIDTDGSDFGDMLKNYGFYNGNRKFRGRKFQNLYKSLSKNGKTVVFDEATKLMWPQGGSDTFLNFFDALEWIENLNQQKYAGYSDWRLPTVEEAASLIERDKSDTGFHIHPKFDMKQSWLWTGDKFDSGHAWYLDFDNGNFGEGIMISFCYVRPVRFVKDTS